MMAARVLAIGSDAICDSAALRPIARAIRRTWPRDAAMRSLLTDAKDGGHGWSVIFACPSVSGFRSASPGGPHASWIDRASAGAKGNREHDPTTVVVVGLRLCSFDGAAPAEGWGRAAPRVAATEAFVKRLVPRQVQLHLVCSLSGTDQNAWPSTSARPCRLPARSC